MTHKLDSYPKDLQKKVTLLQHFRNYFESEGKSLAASLKLGSSSKSEDRKLPHSIYVKKWMKTHHAIIFRLSNKVVQVNFKDNTEILLCSETREVVYANKKGDRATYPLDTALKSDNTEMTKRLTYTKDLLTRMLSAGRTKSGPVEGMQNDLIN